MGEPGWDEWLAGLSEFDRLRAVRLRGQAEQLDLKDAERWTRDEVESDGARTARHLVIRRLWDRAITAYEKPGELDRLPAAQRLLDAGGRLDDLVTVMRAAAYEATQWTLLTVDEGEDDEAPPDSPGWRLMEVGPDGQLTGRDLDGLHDDLTDLVPEDQFEN